MSSVKITAENLEDQFDSGEDITDYFDFDSALILDGKAETRRVNVDFPTWMIESLDREAQRLAISRQAVIKTWIAERLDGTRRSA